MFDDTLAHYRENVVDAFVEYRDLKSDGKLGRSRDLRAALRVATALFHFREHLDPPHELTRAQVEAACSDFALLADIVNAAKHKTLTRPTRSGNPLITDAAQINECIVVTMYEDDLGEYRHAEKTVLVQLNDGTERHLIDILTNVINFWETYLESIKLIDTARTFETKRPIHPITRDQATELALEIVRGHRFKSAWRIQKYDAETGEISPIDLTGANVEFSVYEPPKKVVDIEINHEESGQSFRRTVELSREEQNHFESITDPNDQQAYIQQLPTIRSAVEEIAEEIRLLESENAR